MKIKIKKIGPQNIIMNNPHGKACYFAWPSIARLQNGKIAVVASGYRYGHICPFGKAVISYSENEGETYTIPAPVIDTPLDERDAGILAFGKNGVIITSFNNSVQFQRDNNGYLIASKLEKNKAQSFFEKALALITPEEEKIYLGSEFRISNDCGITFGKLYSSPITSPHGPCELHDGSILWVGRVFTKDDTFTDDSSIQAYKINVDGSMKPVGVIPQFCDANKKVGLCEPYAIELPDGKIICHIRAQNYGNEEQRCFTTLQSESIDGGKTWTQPHRILDILGGAPSHLMLHSSGVIISTYGYREKPYGIKAMFSYDGGKTWDVGHDIFVDDTSEDLGYPCTIELKDGSLLTVFYAYDEENHSNVIMQQKWRMENEI